MLILRYDDIRLPTGNHRLVPAKGRRGVTTSKQYREAKKTLSLLFRSDIPRMFKPFPGYCKVHIALESGKDIDNIDKLVLDSLQEAGVFEKADKQVVDRHTQLIPVVPVKGYKERIKITINSLKELPDGLFE